MYVKLISHSFRLRLIKFPTNKLKMLESNMEMPYMHPADNDFENTSSLHNLLMYSHYFILQLLKVGKEEILQGSDFFFFLLQD